MGQDHDGGNSSFLTGPENKAKITLS